MRCRSRKLQRNSSFKSGGTWPVATLTQAIYAVEFAWACLHFGLMDGHVELSRVFEVIVSSNTAVVDNMYFKTKAIEVASSNRVSADTYGCSTLHSYEAMMRGVNRVVSASSSFATC